MERFRGALQRLICAEIDHYLGDGALSSPSWGSSFRGTRCHQLLRKCWKVQVQVQVQVQVPVQVHVQVQFNT